MALRKVFYEYLRPPSHRSKSGDVIKKLYGAVIAFETGPFLVTNLGMQTLLGIHIKTMHDTRRKRQNKSMVMKMKKNYMRRWPYKAFSTQKRNTSSRSTVSDRLWDFVDQIKTFLGNFRVALISYSGQTSQVWNQCQERLTWKFLFSCGLPFPKKLAHSRNSLQEKHSGRGMVAPGWRRWQEKASKELPASRPSHSRWDTMPTARFYTFPLSDALRQLSCVSVF